MADISKCFGKGCKLKELCYRYTAKADEYMQSYVMADEGLKPDQTHCDMFWPDQYAVEREKDENKTVDEKRKKTKKVLGSTRKRNAR